MSALHEVRASLAAALGCLDHVPDVIDPPCIVLAPGFGYLALGDTFGLADAVVTLDVYVLVEITDGATMADQLDQALPTTLSTLLAEGWGIDPNGIDAPDVHSTADWIAYGIKITASKCVDLTALTVPGIPDFTITD